jgi:sugar lactone lactonase YvrE
MKTVKLLLTAIAVIAVMKSSFATDQNHYLSTIQQSSIRWTGIAVTSDERLFVCYPREGVIPFSVAEFKNGEPVPYPNENWNNWSVSSDGSQHFVCINSIYLDKNNYLWILDAGSALGITINGGAKLVKVDLSLDSIVQVIPFSYPIVRDSCFLNDVRVDTERNFAYISESGIGSIIVVDLTTGISRKLLEYNGSVRGESIPLTVNGQTIVWKGNVNGIALSQNGEYLFYKPLTGFDIFRIPTELLRDSTLNHVNVEAGVDLYCSALPSDGMEFDHHGNLYLNGIEDNAIYYITPGLLFECAIVDSRLKYPEGICITENDEVYVSTTRRLHIPGSYYIFNLRSNPEGIETNFENDGTIRLSNYPNPFQNQTTIHYNLSKADEVTIRVTDLSGKEISRNYYGIQEMGEHQIVYMNDHLSNGIYFCILETGNQRKVQKMIIEK